MCIKPRDGVVENSWRSHSNICAREMNPCTKSRCGFKVNNGNQYERIFQLNFSYFLLSMWVRLVFLSSF